MGEYISILLFFLLIVILATAILFLSFLISPKKRFATDLSPYECGINQATAPGFPISVSYFVIALLFLMFDVEVALLYPWALVFRDFVDNGMGPAMFFFGGSFLLILLVSLFYIFRSGFFEWGEKRFHNK